MSVTMCILGFIGVFFLLAVIIAAMKQDKPFVRAGNAYFASTEVDIKPEDYMDGRLVLNPYKPFHAERIGDEVRVIVYFVKAESCEQNKETNDATANKCGV